MLVNLHVKNLAIIDEVEVDFSENMNVLTGETGAGKSIIIGYGPERIRHWWNYCLPWTAQSSEKH